MVVLNAADGGKVLRRSEVVQFPEWVSVGTTHGRSFTAQSGVDEKGKLLLSWEARAWYAGGAAPTPEIERASRKHAKGVARIDLDSGKVESLPEKADKAPAPPALPKDLGGLKPAQLWTGTDWLTAPVPVGKKVGVLLRGPLPGGEKLELVTWDPVSGRADPRVVLMRGRSLWPQLAGDGRHVFIHQALSKEQLPAGEYAWSIFDLETGKRVAKVPFEPGAQNLTALGGRLFYAIESGGGIRPGGPPGAMKRTRTLRAFDLATGKRLWEHSLWAPPVLLPVP
jgi:hypothetical protein